jgi:hypothetical protein
MKKLLVLLAMVLAFTLTSVAQYGSSSTSGQTSSSGQTSDQTTSDKKSKKSKESSETGASSESGKAGKAKKEATLTGCLNGDPSGNFTLANGKYKKGVKVEPADKIKDHSGHQVQLKGEWKGSGADKSFEVASVKHISDTCKEAPGGGTTGETKKGKKDTKKGKDEGATPPKS